MVRGWQEIAAITGRLRDANAALQSSEAGRKKAEEDLAAATAAAAVSGSAKADADKVGWAELLPGGWLWWPPSASPQSPPFLHSAVGLSC